MRKLSLIALCLAGFGALTGCRLAGIGPDLPEQPADRTIASVDVELGGMPSSREGSRGFTDDGNVASVEIIVRNSSLAIVGNGGLVIQEDGTWYGRIDLSATGLLSFAARGLNASGGALYTGFSSVNIAPTGGTVNIAVSPVNRVTVSSGGHHMLVLKDDGTVWAWGGNDCGQLGDGSTADRFAPVQVQGLTDVIAVSAGYKHSLALKSDGTIWAWGRNTRGQLGDRSSTNRSSPVGVYGISNAVAVSAADAHSVALHADGTVSCWGTGNEKGELGAGNIEYGSNVTSPMRIASTYLSGVVAIDAGGSFTLAVLGTGQIKSWGENSYGQCGTGSTYNTYEPLPVTVTGITTAKSVSAGLAHGLAVLQDGTVKAWGDNSGGKLGNKNTAQSASPVFVLDSAGTATLTGIASVSAGDNHTLAVSTTGAAWGWGNSWSGQVGDGVVSNTRTLPVSITTAGTVSSISAGADQSVAVLADGSIQAWGSNDNGQLGDGAAAIYRSPVPVANGISGATRVSSGAAFNLVLSGTQLLSWGSNTNGSLGNGTTTPSEAPVVVNVTGTPTAFSAGGGHALAVAAGNVWSWGSNSSGQLGRGTAGTSIPAPAAIPGITGAVDVAAGSDFSLALLSDGKVMAWGDNYRGALGSNDKPNDRLIPGYVWTSSTDSNPLSGVTAIAVGYMHALAIISDGTPADGGKLVAWGSNYYGALGTGSSGAAADSGTPVPVLMVPGNPATQLSNVMAIAAGSESSYALLSDGTVLAWGSNSSGQLGDGTTTMRTSPVPVKTSSSVVLSGVAALSADNSTCYALLDTGTVVSWGSNANGQLGNNSPLDTMFGTTFTSKYATAVWTGVSDSTPLSGVSQVSAGYEYALALLSDGSLRAWGSNSQGQAGDGVAAALRYAPRTVSGISVR